MGKAPEIRLNGNKSIVQTVTSSLNKHGEIKGRDKRETKNLRAMCMHHKYTKKGNLRPTIDNDGNGVCTCWMCGKKFTTHIANPDETKEVVDNFMEYVNQAKYSTTAANLGKQAEVYFATLAVNVSHFPKMYGRVRTAIQKKDRTKKKKKGHRNGGGSDSEAFGSWK